MIALAAVCFSLLSAVFGTTTAATAGGRAVYGPYFQLPPAVPTTPSQGIRFPVASRSCFCACVLTVIHRVLLSCHSDRRGNVRPLSSPHLSAAVLQRQLPLAVDLGACTCSQEELLRFCCSGCARIQEAYASPTALLRDRWGLHCPGDAPARARRAG